MVVHQEPGVAKGAIGGIAKVAKDSERPPFVRINLSASDVNDGRLQLDRRRTPCVLTVPKAPRVSTLKKSQA